MADDADLYAELGVPPSASPAQITAAYRRLVRALHPDTHPDDLEAPARLARVTAAYRVLVDAEQRARYDRMRGGARAAPAQHSGQRIPVTVLGGPTRQSPFTSRGWFGADAWPRTSRPGSPPARGPDASADVVLELAEAVHGVTVTVETPDGRVPPRRVRLPAGVVDGQRLRVSGAGDPGRGGAGDLYLMIRVRPDGRVRRHGDDLAVTVPVTFPEAAVGVRVSVPVLGDLVTVDVPPGTPSGATLRLAGRGVRAASRAGDLVVTIVIDVPDTLTDAQQAALQALAATLRNPRSEEGSRR